MDTMTESNKTPSRRTLFAALVFGVLLGYLIARGVSNPAVRSVSNEPLAGQNGVDELSRNEPQKKFVRIVSEQGKEIALQTAISQYRHPKLEDAPIIELVGVVHVGDSAYYENLERELSSYDAVLYELIAPKNARPTLSKAEQSSVSGFQKLLAELLAVVHQLEHIDYTKPNFVHADLSAEALIEEGIQQGETQLTLLLGIVRDVLRANSKLALEKQQPAFESPKSFHELTQWLANPMRLRREFAAALSADSFDIETLGMTTLLPYLIDARNREAMRVMQEQVALGKKHIAVFYGAAHLPDFERRLYEELGYEHHSTRWLSAWDLQKDIPSRSPFQLMMQILDAL